MKPKRNFFPISIAVIALCIGSINTQNLFNSEYESITIYINPLDSSMYSNSDFFLNGSNYYIKLEPGISHKMKLIPIKDSLFKNRTYSKLHLDDLLEIDILNPHNHYSQNLSFYDKFILKCLLLVNFKFNSGDAK